MIIAFLRRAIYNVHMENDELFMLEALKVAREAVLAGDEPFGAVLVKDGEIVFRGRNQIFSRHDLTYHAECGLIRDYFAKTCAKDLSDCTLYSTCEPCYMCCGAIYFAKLKRLVYGASDMELASIIDEVGAHPTKTVLKDGDRNIEVVGGVLRSECKKLLEEYFSIHAKF